MMKSLYLILFSFFPVFSENEIHIPKVNPDSVTEITYLDEGYTSRSTAGYQAQMKNGDSVVILYDQNANYNPTIAVSKNKAWFTFFNPNFIEKKKNCSKILCSLKFGLCKCADVVSDSGSEFSEFQHNGKGGFRMYTEPNKNKNSKLQNKKREHQSLFSEEEMTKRFLEDYNKIPKL